MLLRLACRCWYTVTPITAMVMKKPAPKRRQNRVARLTSLTAGDSLAATGSSGIVSGRVWPAEMGAGATFTWSLRFRVTDGSSGLVLAAHVGGVGNIPPRPAADKTKSARNHSEG